MPESAAAVVPVVAATPAAVAVAPIAAAPKGGVIPGETFAQTMERHGGFTAPDGSPATDEPRIAPSAPEKAPKGKRGAKGKGAPAAAEAAPVVEIPVNTAPDKRAQLLAIAAELGMEVNDAEVTVAERVAFREAQKKHAARLETQEQDVLRRLQEAKGGFATEIEQAKALRAAYDAGDYDGLAKLLGPKDWNALQEEMIAKISDPNYKRLRQLEQKEQEREREAEQRRIAGERAAFQQKQLEARQIVEARLSAQMKNSADPLVAALHDDPQFIAAVIEVQRQNWDGSSTVSPEKAIKIAAKGFTGPLHQHMQNLYQKLQKAFGATPAQAAAVVAAVAPAAAAVVAPTPGKGKTNRTGVVPTAATGAAAGAVDMTKLSKKEKDAYFSARLQEAIAEERAGEG